MGVFVLGPTKWQRGYAPDVPSWVAGELPPDWKLRGRDVLSPLDVRAGLAAHLEGHKHDALLMERFPRKTLQGRPETNTGLFKRIAGQATQFFVYWPYGAQRPGVDWELGILASWLEEERPIDVRLFVEDAAGVSRTTASNRARKGAGPPTTRTSSSSDAPSSNGKATTRCGRPCCITPSDRAGRRAAHPPRRWAPSVSFALGRL